MMVSGGVVPRVDCAGCVGACCRAGLTIDLSDQEAVQLQAVGTQIEVASRHGHEPHIRRGETRYDLVSDCGNLVTDVDGRAAYCGDYDNRPKACRRFPVGQYVCLSLRNEQGIDEPVIFETYKRNTQS
jgi:Fe-S-cluster containining protein